MIKELVNRNAVALFWTLGVIYLASFTAGILLQELWPLAVIPLTMVVLIAIWDLRILFFLLILLMPLSIEFDLPGGFGTDLPTEPLTVFLMLAGGLVLFLHRKDPSFSAVLRHPLTLLIALHVIWTGLTTVFAADRFVSVKFLLAKTWYVVVFFFLAAYFVNGIRQVRILFWCLLTTSMAAFAYVMIRHNMDGFSFDVVNYVVRPVFRNHVTYGVWAAMMVPLIIMALTWYKRGSLERLILWGSLALTLACVYFSYTRGAWLALIAGLLYLPILHFRLTRAAALTSVALLMVLAVFLASDNKYLDYAPEYESTIYHEDFSEHLSATFQMQDMSTMERFYRWIAAIRMVQEYPVTGVGPANFVGTYKSHTVTSFMTYISDNEEGSTVHNYFLLMLSEQGIPGFLVVLTLVLFAMVQFEKTYHREADRRRKGVILGLALGFLVLLVNNVFSDLLEADKLGPMFFIFLAVLVRFSTGQSQESTAQNADVIAE